ncbi:LOW QUALITY PROTEIN: LIM domain only protein 7 [Syngnathoides biaculeatus]|uniref:LOW QUALITY PROTEIN: LIM domain only protein 7 n=1 Tax=Syngnathoides biaculeatus TaxID=300417 RepID=UPI002ADE91F9|nr:LOW QUALITY PROTEIN: LIM domain only protein 7 [Syngnathoides biaculeatus]
MEWREQSTVSCQDAFVEARRWIEAVTKKTFKGKDFRSALENGILLCDVINKIKPGTVRRVNRLPTPIAGLDNINVFLKGCLKLGLKEAQLFHPGDLQDLSSRVTVNDEETDRRLKNVLITLYWLGRRAQGERSYDGPYLNFKAFEGLLGTALHKALQELSGQKGNTGLGDSWDSEPEELHQSRESQGRGGGHRRDDSLDSLDSLGSQPLSISSDATLKGSSEGCCSDAEADAAFRMADKESLAYRRSVTLTPKVTTQFNQFLPTKDKPTGYVPAPLRKKRAERNDDSRRSWANPVYEEEDDVPIVRPPPDKSPASPAAHQRRAFEYESGSDSDSERPDPDLVTDDLASRRFHSPPPAPPVNFSVPVGPAPGGPRPRGTVSSGVARSGGEEQKAERRPPVSTDSLFSDPYGDSEDEDDEVGYADPVQDDLYARKVGAGLLVAGDASHHKFLPKLWTPQEDVHVRKIKTGSQRPWYRKMQGFSRKSSGSSSDDSEPDVAPRPPSGPPPPRPSAAHNAKSPPVHPHSTPHLPKTALLETPSLAFAPVDPTSGPRLVKCQRWPLLGRQDPREPPDPIDYDSIVPDLENDDMFARRTLAFRSNSELAAAKTPLSAKRCLFTSEEQINIVTQLPIKEEEEYPNIEQDDVVQRREKIQQQRRPLSGAPDNFSPLAVPEPWDLPPELKTRLLCPPCPLARESPAKTSARVRTEPRPETDDMLVRKLAALHGKVSANQGGPRAPASCSEGDLQRWQAIREASQRRHKKRLMVQMLTAVKLQRQTSNSFDGSKSTSDIAEESVLVRRRSQYEALEKYREHVKQSDDKWQDDLSKWKNRRKSVNSDIVRKKEEREQVERITSGGSTRRSKTYKEMQDDRENRRSGSVGSRIGRLSFDEDSDVFEKPKPRTRDSLSRSYTVDTIHHSSGSSEAAQKENKTPVVPLRATKAEADATDAPSGSATRSSFHRPKPSETTSSLRSSVFDSKAETEAISPPPRLSQKLPEPKNPVKVEPPSSGSLSKPPLGNKTEAKAEAVSRISASLPRSYQRSDSLRLSSVVTPRPFGTQPSRIGSLTRSFTSDDSNSRVNGSGAVSVKRPVASRYRQFMTAEDEAQSRSSPDQSSEDDDDDKQEETTGESLTFASSISSHPVPVRREVSAKGPHEESSCEMRISLNQKPNSSRDFGFDVAWESGGAHVKSIQRGSPAETFQLQAGDEVLTVNGHQVADMSYLDWKASMERALQEGGLVMDIRRHGKSNWDDRDPSSPPFQGRKTVNLTRADHPILVGFPDAGSASTLDFTSLADTSAKVATRSVVDLASNGVDGGYPKVSMTTAESEPISMINIKRRSQFFERGGAESIMPDIPVPPITTSSARWSWDPEEERRRQEKWQREQERQLQEKYKRDQEKLQEEWTKAQEEIANSGPQRETVGSTFTSWELERQRETWQEEVEEERERSKLEAERKRMEEEFERQRREMRRREEELERERQEVERKRREREEELERRRREEELERERQEVERKRRERGRAGEEEAGGGAGARERQEVERKRREREEELERRRREEELERERQEVERKRREQEEELERQRLERRRREEELERQKAEERKRAAEEEERREREVEEERRRKEEEERRWREEREVEEERQRQEEEERRRREEAERREREVEEEEEERRQREEELLWQRRREAEKEELRRRTARERAAQEQRMKSLEEERLESRGSDAADAKAPQPTSQAELQRQQLLNDMKKKTNLLTDSSWIRQRSGSAPGREDPPSTPRGGFLGHRDEPPNSWRSSWTPGTDPHIPNYSRPRSAYLAGAPFHFASGAPPLSFRGPAAETTPWSRRATSPSLPPAAWSEPGSDPGCLQQRNRSVSGKKVCTSCQTALGKGAAMIIESLGLCYHLSCFKCVECKSALGGSEAGAEVRIRNKQLYCNSCFVRFQRPVSQPEARGLTRGPGEHHICGPKPNASNCLKKATNVS